LSDRSPQPPAELLAEHAVLAAQNGRSSTSWHRVLRRSDWIYAFRMSCSISQRVWLDRSAESVFETCAPVQDWLRLRSIIRMARSALPCIANSKPAQRYHLRRAHRVPSAPRALAREGKAFDEESAECAVGVFACRRM
jgi:hypothetical protein